MIDSTNVNILGQFISAMSEAYDKLEEAYMKKDIVNLEKSKKLILELESKISLMLK